MVRLIIPSQTRFIGEAVATLVRFVKIRVPHIEENELAVALSEALTNAIIHGNREDSSKRVIAWAEIRPCKIIFTVTDEGSGFDHSSLTDPRKKENFFQNHGRGLFMIRNFMDEVRFNQSGSQITMIKYINQVDDRDAKKSQTKFLTAARCPD